MMDRFVLREVKTEYGSEYVELVDTKTGEVVGSDGGEPEDNTFYRDWSWVPELLNKVANGG
jgi:hypothetical protein